MRVILQFHMFLLKSCKTRLKTWLSYCRRQFTEPSAIEEKLIWLLLFFFNLRENDFHNCLSWKWSLSRVFYFFLLLFSCCTVHTTQHSNVPSLDNFGKLSSSTSSSKLYFVTFSNIFSVLNAKYAQDNRYNINVIAKILSNKLTLLLIHQKSELIYWTNVYNFRINSI